MMPTIIPGDRIVVDKLAYGLEFRLANAPISGIPKRSDVIVFRAPKTDVLTVKRVIGLPGDRVSWDGDHLRVNAETANYRILQPEEEPGFRYLEYSHTRRRQEQLLGVQREILQYRITPRRGSGTFSEVVVPDEHYLVLGQSGQQRRFPQSGFVPRGNLVGQATMFFSR